MTERPLPAVVAIVGFPHSGSTLLGDILASSPGVMHVGETAVLFRHVDRHPDSVCSCGERITTCELWGPALAARPADAPRDAAVVAQDVLRVVQERHPPAPYLAELYGTLLRHVARESRSRVLVDSSNWPSFGRLLHTATAGNTAYIHLVRDSRAAVHSRTRRGGRWYLTGAPRYRVMASVVQDARRWNAWNASPKRWQTSAQPTRGFATRTSYATPSRHWAR